MAYFDYNSIWNGTFAKFKLPTKAVLHVIACICNQETGEFNHSVPTIARLTGISHRSVRYALQELETTKPALIESTARTGKPACRIYLPTANFSKSTPALHAGLPLHQVQASTDQNRPEKHPQTQQPSASTKTANSLLFFKQQDLKTTTAADRVSRQLIKQMIAEYGSDRVVVILKAMEGFNGEIKNANAYFRKCCLENWVPTSKLIREREKMAERREAERRRSEELQQEHEAKVTNMDDIWNNPERLGSIQAEMEKINALLADA